MARPKGIPKTGGRQKGTPNKLTLELKDMILKALDEVGGKEYLKTQSAVSPTAFLTLVGKVLPIQQQHSGPGGKPIEFQQSDRPKLTKEEWLETHGLGTAARPTK